MTDLVPPPIAASLAAGQRASNLAFTLFFLPRQRRDDALVFYRFCRIVDDIADDPDFPFAEKRTALDAWLAALEDPALPGVPTDIARVIRTHDLDRHLLAEIVRGVAMDTEVTRYRTFDELRLYCWRVASAVGLVSIRVFGCTQPASRAYAEALGLALQLTNILRDVGEDAALGRIYLPIDDLARFGVSEDQILRGTHDVGFVEMMQFQARRAGEFYEQAAAALPAPDRDALRAAEMMRAIYSRVLRRMDRDNFRVFDRRYRLNRFEKILTALTQAARSVIRR